MSQIYILPFTSLPYHSQHYFLSVSTSIMFANQIPRPPKKSHISIYNSDELYELFQHHDMNN